MKKSVIVLLILLYLPFFGTAQQKIEFEEFTLENGLHVILQQDNSLPLIAINIMYHVGSKNENPQRTGFAHFFEHLMFEGTKHIPRGEFDKYVERAGGTLNAGTSFDYTTYYLLLPSNELELGLWLESERLLHPVIDSTGIATQKSVVIEEKKQTQDNRPYGRILYETLKRAYTQHPYQWVVIGDENHIRDAEDHEFEEFHQMFYVPQNAVLVIAGDIQKAEARKVVEKYFADIPAGIKEIYRPEPSEPVKNSEVRDVVYDNVQLPAIIQAYHIPSQGDDDYYAVEMLGNLLSQGQSSRLYKSMVDEQQLAISVSAIPLGLEHPGLFINLAIPNMGIEPEALEEALDKEIEKVRNELISEAEMQKIKNQFENRIINRNTTIASRALNLANYYTFFRDANLINTEIEKYMAVTREDIQRVAQKYFNKENRVVLYYMPESENN